MKTHLDVLRESTKTPVIIHAPEAVASNASNLAKAERELGWSSSLYYYGKNNYDSVHNKDIKIPSGINRFVAVGKIIFGDCLRATLIHFNAGRSFFPFRKVITENDGLIKRMIKKVYNFFINPLEWSDIRFFCYMGKKVFITFQGDDGRLHNYHRKNYKFTHAHVLDPILESYKDELKIKLQFKLSKLNCAIFAVNPDLIHTLPKGHFLPYTNVNLNDWQFIEKSQNPIPKIVHAPSHSGVKGTEYILNAINRLKADGLEFEFQLITGIPHHQVKNIFESADLLIDQLLVGWYGGVAVECMALGVPVICYLREEDLKFIPRKMREEIPVLNANPENIYDVLKKFLQNYSKISEMRMKSRKYVEKWHNPEIVAKYLQEVATISSEATFPEFNPEKYL